MSESPYDRFHVDLTVSQIRSSDSWGIANEVWTSMLDRIRSDEAGSHLEVEANLWVSGVNGFDVKRDNFADLKRASTRSITGIAFMFFSAQLFGRDGLTGMTLFFRPAEQFLLLSVRGNSRYSVDHAGKILAANFLDSRRLNHTLGGKSLVKLEPIGVSTTDLLKEQTSPSTAAEHGASLASINNSELGREIREQTKGANTDKFLLPHPRRPYKSSPLDEPEDRLLTDSAVVSLAASILRSVTSSARLGHSLEPNPQAYARPVREEGWFRRTWRDNTATFIMLVVSGLLVAIVAALVGINFLPNLLAHPIPTSSIPTSK